jgi:hypothetical protein
MFTPTREPYLLKKLFAFNSIIRNPFFNFKELYFSEFKKKDF